MGTALWFAVAGLATACGGGGGSGKNTSSAGAGSGGGGSGGAGNKPTPIDVEPTPTSVDASCKGATEGPFSNSLPTPSNVVVEEDDYSARFQWGGELNDESPPRGVEGYRLCWGEKAGAPSYGVLSTKRITQVFGVQPGKTYVAYLQSVDNMGNASAPAQVEFKADSTRVDKLRATMTGFFDDFNTPAGAIDELKWNTAYSFCNDPVVNGTYVVDTHAMNLIGNRSSLPGSVPGCDRNQNISRARALFDFSGREGIISFDFDGTDGDRSTWYASVFPYDGNPSDYIDITGHATFDPGGGHPGRFLRFSQAGNLLMINRYDEKGEAPQVFKTEIGVTFPNQQIVPGVMRHWELRVSKNYASISIDGQKVLEAPGLGLDFEKGFVTWDQFAYNPAKTGRPWVALSFDNFGFDGPRVAPPIHNYKLALFGGDMYSLGFEPDYNHDVDVTLAIPDKLEGATKARFFMTIQNNNYEWKETDSFSINGQVFPIPMPTSPTGRNIGVDLIDDFRPFVSVTEVPVSALLEGDNAVTIHAEKSRLQNVHLEVEFPPGKAPSYTQPRKIFSDVVVPEVPFIGPSAIVSHVNQQENNYGDDAKSFLKNAVPVKGTVEFGITIDNVRPTLASGKNLGVSHVQLLVDNVVVQDIETQVNSPAPAASELLITLDTTKLSNGKHEVFVVAYDSAGSKGRPGYGGEWGAKPDDYAPVLIDVSN